ncbi:universal stress protein [Pseudarthrobacter albicanus]|uniref:universal stress protein n=1 Tax=Pseudarthrobacter albicanus TaxID=2823873 RepID=UPI001BA6885F|nr:universal stress protein [Pseudarthrobacter albicanus]
MAPAAEYPRSTIAVGYDGSLTARLGVRWAAEYAADEQCRLRVIHAWVWPLFTKSLGPVKGIPGSGLRHSGEAILAEGVQLARGFASASAAGAPAAAVGVDVGPPADAGVPGAPAPGVDVEGVMETGLPAPVLREAAAGARLLVVGSRGVGGVMGQLAVSVCLDLAASSPCPLMVIRRPRAPGAPVVAGVDASARGLATLAGAVRLAVALRTSLRLVHVDHARAGGKEAHGRHAPLHGQELLDHALREARELAPGLTVSGTLREGRSAATELLAAASEADVLVLGTHNRGGGPGNTVSAVLHKAPCNVLVTR